MYIDEDKPLLYRLVESDEVAFEILFKRYQNKVFGYAMKISQSKIQAEEIVQNVFLQIWINRAGLNKIDNFGGYVRVMARNEALQFLRRVAIENRHQNNVAHEWTEIHNETEQSLQFNEARHLLNNVIDALPTQQKLVYNMCHLEGRKQQDVALKLHISPLTVKSHLRQAVLKVRKAMYIKIGAAILFLFTIVS